MTLGWNRCDVCGRFISYQDFDDGLAFRYMKTPDSHYTAETYVTLCRDHKEVSDGTNH
jgi:hypothetical protein